MRLIHKVFESQAMQQLNDGEGIEGDTLVVKLKHKGTNFTLKCNADFSSVRDRADRLRKSVNRIGTGKSKGAKTWYKELNRSKTYMK